MSVDEPVMHPVGEKTPSLRQAGEHDLCPGCGEPVAIRILLETIAELGLSQSTIGVLGIGCYTAFARPLAADIEQALHGQAPSVATGIKRTRPATPVLTPQGAGEMVNAGLQMGLTTAARSENV